MNFDTLYDRLINGEENEFKAMTLNAIRKLYKDSTEEEKVLIDVKGLYSIDNFKMSKMKWWRL